MDDLISRKAVLDALGECQENWEDSPEEVEAVNSWLYAMNAICSTPSVDAIPIEPLAVWLAGYHVSPPEYALIQTGEYDEIDPASVVYTASQSAKAWAYHLRKLMESGLMDG